MNRRMWNNRVPGKVAAIVGLLIVATGLCLFHIDHHGGSKSGMCMDPCAGLVSSFVVALLSGLLAAHFRPFDKALLMYAVPIRVLELPPKPLTLS